MATTNPDAGPHYNAVPLLANEPPTEPLYDPYDPVEDLGAPRPRFLGNSASIGGGGNPEIRASYASSRRTESDVSSHARPDSEYNNSVVNLHTGYRDDPNAPPSPGPTDRMFIDEKNALYAPPRSTRRRKALIWGGVVAGIVLVAAVVVAVYFAVIKPKHDKDTNGSTKSGASSSDSNSGSGGGTGAANPVAAIAVTGGDGTMVTMDDGSTFQYSNKFGGYWYADPNDPYKSAAKANSWTPALNETFKYGQDKINGVNLGGWLVLEPFICPAVFEPYVSKGVIDEYTLHTAMRADTANGGISQLEEHYKTFITEKDFADIAAAGLNYVRIPLPYWAIEVRDNEPFEPKTPWTYFLKAIQWARKYGLRINLDFHSLPGSQNGWDHSGKKGSTNVLNGPMGIANAQRALDYIRILAEFISQPEYKDVVTMFGITNEPQGNLVTQPVLSSYYLQAYNMVRGASGTGEGNGPFISYHDGFIPRDQWANFLPNADRISLDSHPYICFGDQSSDPISTRVSEPCDQWGASFNQSMHDFGLSAAGEFSNAVTDCGLYVTGIGEGTRYEGTYTGDGKTYPKKGDCSEWTDYQNFDQAMKDGLKAFNMASMDALQNWFFWTWKIGNSSVTGKVESPQWSYSLGLQQGWIPQDPRQAIGKCGNTSPWTPPLKPYQTGGNGAGQIPASATQALPWPPASIGPTTNGAVQTAATLLPMYTPTGAVPTLTAPAVTMSGATATPSPGSGWANSADTAGMMVPVAGCSYLDPWIGSAAPPSPLCSAVAS